MGSFLPPRLNRLPHFLFPIPYSLFPLFRWRGRFVLGLLLGLFLVILASPIPAVAKDLPPKTHDQLTFPPLPELQLPPYERYTLPNGLVVYLMPDRRLPLVSGTALIRTGSRWEPADKIGLASLTGMAWRSGGTQTHPPAELNQLLEQRAAAIETSIGTSSGSASFSALSKDLEPVLTLFADVIQSPAFDPAQVNLAKTQLQGAIARRNDDPGAIASREGQKTIYGDTSPYARTETFQTLGAIQRQDLMDFYQRYTRPDQMILGFGGDFDPQTVKPLVEKLFGSWQNLTPAPDLTPPPATAAHSGKLFLVDLPHVSQSQVFMGQLGGRVDDPDYPALTVMNGVLGGFGGRLFSNIRSKQGLAYSVSGRWQAAFDYDGYFGGGGSTRTEMTVPFIQSLYQELERIRQTPVTPAELVYAKDSILNSFVFNFERPAQTLSRLMTYEYFGYPANFIFTYQRQVKATTREDVQRVAENHLQPSAMVTLVVGQGDRLKESLETLNKPVIPVDIALPPLSPP